MAKLIGFQEDCVYKGYSGTIGIFNQVIRKSKDEKPYILRVLRRMPWGMLMVYIEDPMLRIDKDDSPEWAKVYVVRIEKGETEKGTPCEYIRFSERIFTASREVD